MLATDTSRLDSGVTLANLADVDWHALVSSPEPTLNIETMPLESSLRGEPMILQLRSSAGRGLGLYATQSISQGTTILSEPPLLTTIRYPATLEDIQTLINELGPLRSRLYMSLYSDYNDTDPSQQPIQIFRTNCFSLAKSSDGVEELGIFGLASRFNHACQHSFRSANPTNVAWKWDEMRREMVFTTMWAVEKGDELLINYRLTESQTASMLGGEACPICKYV